MYYKITKPKLSKNKSIMAQARRIALAIKMAKKKKKCKSIPKLKK